MMFRSGPLTKSLVVQPLPIPPACARAAQEGRSGQVDSERENMEEEHTSYRRQSEVFEDI